MIALLISDRLKERNWTKAHLARMTGIRPNTIGDLVNGFANRIQLDQLDLICDALECDICDVLSRNTK